MGGRYSVAEDVTDVVLVISPEMQTSPSTCRVLTSDCHVHGLYYVTAVFGTHVVCASARVSSLPGGLLPSQHKRRSIVFRVLFQQTNKQTSDKQLDFKAPWCHVRWLKDSCTPQPLHDGTVLDEDCDIANGHVAALHEDLFGNL